MPLQTAQWLTRQCDIAIVQSGRDEFMYKRWVLTQHTLLVVKTRAEDRIGNICYSASSRSPVALYNVGQDNDETVQPLQSVDETLIKMRKVTVTTTVDVYELNKDDHNYVNKS